MPGINIVPGLFGGENSRVDGDLFRPDPPDPDGYDSFGDFPDDGFDE